MAGWLIALANTAANVAGAPANHAPPATVGAQDFLVPAWLVAGGVIALAIAVVALASIVARVLAKPASNKKGFTEMLCKQVWASTDVVTGTFAERLRQIPPEIVSLRVLVRTLREDLSGPIHFIDQMHAHPPAAWPDLDLFAAFTQWGGQIKSMGSQLADLQQATTYPVVKEPVDKNRDAMLIHHYLTEQAVFIRAVDNLKALAYGICKAAKPHLGDHKDGDDCPCCTHYGDHGAAPTRVSVKIKIPPLPKASPPPPPPPAPMVCHCMAPRPCQCAHGCGCVCVCTAPAPAPAKAI